MSYRFWCWRDIFNNASGIKKSNLINIAWKVSKYEVFSGPYFAVFGLNTGKYRPEKTSYLDTFHAVKVVIIV